MEAEQARLNEQAKAWNAPPEALALLAKQQPEESDDVQVWPENVLSMMLFLTCQTQWHFAGMAGARTGLNWQSMELAMARSAEVRRLNDEAKDELFDDLVLLERVALTEIRQYEKQQQNNKP